MPSWSDRVGHNDDDWRHKQIGTPPHDMYATRLIMGSTGGGDSPYDWLCRWTNVTIPPGSTILSAIVRFTCDETRASQALDIDIWGEAVANPARPTGTDADFHTHIGSPTSAKVDWVDTVSWTIDIDYDTPDLTDIIQEIIELSGWASGNAMVIFGSDQVATGAWVAGYQYNDSAADAAQLIVSYTPPAVVEALPHILETQVQRIPDRMVLV